MSFQERRTSFLMFVSATGGSSGEATRRANAIADALVAWDDERVRQEMTKVLRSLESQLAALQEQLAQLQALGSRANLPQMASISVLSNELRRDIAMARADAVSARGNLEVIEPAARGSQVAPSPLVDAVIAFALVAAAVLAVGLVRAATTRRIRGAESLAEAAGTPLLVDLTRPSGRPGQRRRGTTEMQFLKAHLDRTLAPGAAVLVAGLDRAAAADHVAAELDRLYAQAGSVTSVQVGAALLSSGEAIERAARADAVVVVAEPRSTDRVELQQAMAWLRRARANVVGLVATGEKAASRSAPRQAVGRAL